MKRAVLQTHKFDKVLKVTDSSYRLAVLEYFNNALQSDGQDLTTKLVLDGSLRVSAVLVARGTGVLAGMEELQFFLKTFGGVMVVRPMKDGSLIKRGQVLCELEGRAATVLFLERTILNFLQRMSGVATLARTYVRAAGPGVLVCPTRKTLWGVLDKNACVVGGAGTHRLNLSDAVLVKDTHLDLLGHSFEKLGERLVRAGDLGRFVEIEVESLREGLKAVEVLKELRGAGRVAVGRRSRGIPCFVMLDNMTLPEVRKFVRLVRGSGIFVEASGGITLRNIRRYARTGVDVLSVGAVTHSAPALDISLKIEKRPSTHRNQQ